MTYTLFFLMGIPFWLIACARVLRSADNRPGLKTRRPGLKLAWAAVAFMAPLALLGLSSITHLLVVQRLGEAAVWSRGLGYFLVLVNLFAFFSAFAVSSVYESRYGGPRGGRAKLSFEFLRCYF